MFSPIVIIILCYIFRTQTGGKREISLQQIQNTHGKMFIKKYLNENIDANFYQTHVAAITLSKGKDREEELYRGWASVFFSSKFIKIITEVPPKSTKCIGINKVQLQDKNHIRKKLFLILKNNI